MNLNRLNKMNPPLLKSLQPEESGNNRFLFIWMLVLVMIKLWLLQGQGLHATYTPHDDYLFIKLAKHILSGNWLGPYDSFTLIKGPVYPIFIAIVHHTGIPLLLAQQLLYSSFCVLAIMAFRPLVRSKTLLLSLFFLLLFNPFTYFPEAARAFRFSLTMPLVLALFSSIGSLLIKCDSSFRVKTGWSIAIGLLFSLIWYAREESIWLLPSLFLFILCFLLLGNNLTFRKIIVRVIVLLPIPVIFTIFSLTFSHLNQKYYGSSCIVELKTAEFQSALGGLMNINVVESKRYVPVPSANQNAAYKVSPTFKQLQPYFEQNAKGLHMPSSFYIWTLRDLAWKSGNCNSLPEALAFYKKMGSEINEACSTGKIPCLDRKQTIRPVWRTEYNVLIPGTFWDIFRQAITFNGFSLKASKYNTLISNANEEMLKDYRFVTREKLIPQYGHSVPTDYPDYYLHMIIEKLRILSDVGKAYKVVVPFLFTLALLIHLYFSIQSFRRKSFDFPTIYGFIILGGILSLVSVLTYVKITLWPIFRPLFSAYPLVLLYIITMLIFFNLSIKNRTDE